MVDLQFWDEVNTSIRDKVGSSFDGRPASAVGGGCVNHAQRLLDRTGNVAYFVKHNNGDLLPMFETEVQGLAAIAKTGTIRVPNTVCCGLANGRAYMVQEWMDLGGNTDWRSLGSKLAELHSCSPSERYGWDHNNFIGATGQINDWHDGWQDFFFNQRLEVQRKLAEERGGTVERYDELINALPNILEGHEPKPSLVHGDLWTGNVAFSNTGEPVIFDVAVYFGDREVDLAMSQLFGSFDRGFYMAYRSERPLDPGYERRRTLYNLYHVLNHYNLFGGFYLSQANGMIAELLR